MLAASKVEPHILWSCLEQVLLHQGAKLGVHQIGHFLGDLNQNRKRVFLFLCGLSEMNDVCPKEEGI